MVDLDKTRLCRVEEYERDHPGTVWIAHPEGVNQPEIRMDTGEISKPLPCCEDMTPEPPPVKLMDLKLAFEMSVRSGPGTTYPTLGKLALGTVASFVADERPSANGYTWRRLADGYEGQAVAWIAEATADGSKVYLTDPR